MFWKKKVPPESAAGEQPGAVPRKRIAVLGLADVNASSPEWVVRSFPWSYGGETTVVADYDVAVVNLLDTARQESFIERGLPAEIDGNVVLGLLRAARQLLLTGGEIVVLGHPDVHVKPRPEGQFVGHWSSLPEWHGMRIEWDESAGDHVELLVTEKETGPAAPFLPYLRLLTRYDYSLISAQPSEHFLPSARLPPAAGPAGTVERTLEVATRPLAKTRRGGAVASEHRLRVYSRPIARRSDGWTAREGGTVLLLPGCGMAPRETVAFVLREVYGVHTALSAPPWLAGIPAPGEAPVIAQLSAAQLELDAAASRMAALEAQRNEVRAVLGVLAAADDELEDRVRDLLGRLGAEIEAPIEKNKADGWIHVTVAGTVLNGVLEIKSAQGETFDEKGARQLMDWVKRTKEARGEDYKGIFIGNAAFARPPAERPDPFSSSFRKTCETHGFVALTAATLLRELGRVVDEGADPATFWGELFQTRGVLD